MKNNIQVKHYLQDKAFKTSLDYTMITTYCSQKLNITLEKHKYSQDSYAITCADFVEWMNSGIEAGEMVKSGNLLGIVINSTPEDVLIYSINDFEAPIFNYNTVSIQDIQPVDKSAANRFFELLRDHDKEFSRLLLDITDKFIPKVDDIVMFTRIDTFQDDKCYGIVRMIEDGDVIMYCYCDEKDEMHYSPELRENIGPHTNYHFTKIDSTNYGRKKLEVLLNKKGMSWNHAAKRIESLDMRAEKGALYHYINDKMMVATAREDRNPCTAAAKRYSVGNYSKNKEKMMRCQQEIAEVLKKYMAEPE